MTSILNKGWDYTEIHYDVKADDQLKATSSFRSRF